MRAHAVVALVLRSFSVNVQVKVGDEAREAVGVFNLHMRTVPESEIERIGSRIVPQGEGEETLRARLAHGMRGASHPDCRIPGLRKERAHFPAVVRLMRPQHVKRVAVRAVQNGFQLERSHAQLLWQRA